MKHLKKIAALAVIAACCCTGRTSIDAKASVEELTTCNHDNLSYDYAGHEIIAKGTHEYYYYTDRNNNGIMEKTKAECFYVAVVEMFSVSCPCGKENRIMPGEVQEIHFNCGR